MEHFYTGSSGIPLIFLANFVSGVSVLHKKVATSLKTFLNNKTF